MEQHPHAYFMRKEQAAGRLPSAYAERVDRLHTQTRHGRKGIATLSHEWEQLTEQYRNRIRSASGAGRAARHGPTTARTRPRARDRAYRVDGEFSERPSRAPGLDGGLSGIGPWSPRGSRRWKRGTRTTCSPCCCARRPNSNRLSPNSNHRCGPIRNRSFALTSGQSHSAAIWNRPAQTIPMDSPDSSQSSFGIEHGARNMRRSSFR